ncbi:MAG: adenylosuccinate synthase, partial [Thermoflexia bacterium]
MPAILVVGAQWGDEGKGRVVDDLARQAHLVARYNGGDNAGHTVVAQGHVLRLHLVPSGILHPHTVCLIGAGVVVNPVQLAKELDELAALGIDVGPGRVKLSAAAHVILPTHQALDGAREAARGQQAIGTTRRGIGPVYADKAARVGLRAGQMTDVEAFGEQVAALVQSHNRLLVEHYGLEPVPVEKTVQEYVALARRLRSYVADVSEIVAEALAAGKTLLCEGAQGTLLDLDHGTYPFVTSSSCVAGGALAGLGFGPGHVQRVIGVAKAYTTRVGAGPFPTELTDETGVRIREAGGEYGTTTGRPRRCGWLDLPILRYAVQVNGLTELALTKLDVLTGIHPLRVAVAYEQEGRRTGRFPGEYGAEGLAHWQPVYEELPGWDADIRVARQWEDLPPEAQAYVRCVEEAVGVPVTFIG